WRGRLNFAGTRSFRTQEQRSPDSRIGEMRLLMPHFGFAVCRRNAHRRAMDSASEPQDDFLWKEYSTVFRDFDDLTLARWMAQTLGQLSGRAWRMSHALVAALRLAAAVGHEREIWFKRLATLPHAFVEAPCCRAPLLPLWSRDILDTGLIC